MFLWCYFPIETKRQMAKRRFNQDPNLGDERLALIPATWAENRRVLDVGCNVGKVTIEIGPFHKVLQHL